MTWTKQKILRRGGKNTQRDIQKCVHDTDNHECVIIILEPDNLECKIKWALASITMSKVSEGDGISVELFQILKDDAVKVVPSKCQQIWKTSVATRLEKISFHSNAKDCSNSCTHLTG